MGVLGQRKNDFLGDGPHFVDDGVHLSLIVYGLLHEIGLCSVQTTTVSVARSTPCCRQCRCRSLEAMTSTASLLSAGEILIRGVIRGVSPAYCSILWNQMIFKTKSDKTRAPFFWSGPRCPALAGHKTRQYPRHWKSNSQQLGCRGPGYFGKIVPSAAQGGLSEKSTTLLRDCREH